jgi:hypothetical protein
MTGGANDDVAHGSFIVRDAALKKAKTGSGPMNADGRRLKTRGPARDILEPDEGAEGNPAWHAYCPALVNIGAATSGRTREEALKTIHAVVRMIVQEPA